MKIGILTLPLHINYGGYLQAFALKSILLEHGNEVYLIENKNLYGNLLKCGLRQIKDSFSLLLFYLGKKNKEAEFILKEKKISIFKDNYMCPIVDISNSKTLNDLDIVIVGSDQVWRPWKGLCRNSLYFFLDFIKSTKTKKISYAASFGIDKWEYNPVETIQIKKLLQDFSIISVREDDGVSLLQDNLGLPSIRMCDPTLLLTKNDYLSTLRIHHPDNDRISSYILDSNSSKDDMLKIVASFFKNDVLPLGYSEDNGVSSINDWVRHLVSSKFLITDSFHGTLFAINFNIPFVTLLNKNRGVSRIKSLLGTYSLCGRIAYSENDVINICNSAIDWDKVNSIIITERNKGINQLKSIIE